jgi:hypothetical protein
MKPELRGERTSGVTPSPTCELDALWAPILAPAPVMGQTIRFISLLTGVTLLRLSRLVRLREGD